MGGWCDASQFSSELICFRPIRDLDFRWRRNSLSSFFNSEIVWRAPMASIDSTSKLSSVLNSLSQTLVEFRAESAEIEAKFYELVDGFAELGPSALDDSTTSGTQAMLAPEMVESATVERLETLDRSLAEQRHEFVAKQDQLADDVGRLSQLVDRQFQLFAAWINATSKPKKTNSRGKGSQKAGLEDEVLNDVFAQFEELRGATVAAGAGSKT